MHVNGKQFVHNFLPVKMYTWSIFQGVDTFLDREMTQANQGCREKVEAARGGGV